MPRTKGWLMIIVLLLVCTLLIMRRSKHVSLQSSHLFPTSATNTVIWEPFGRLSRSGQQTLVSALAHIRNGNLAHLTPNFDTPPLLVLQKCQLANQQCGGVVERLMTMTSAYYFALLWEGAAFASDDVSEFFDTSGSSIAAEQARMYLDKADKATVRVQGRMLTDDLSRLDYMTQYRNEQVRIVQTKEWDDWLAMKSNPTMRRPLDRFRLSAASRSEWFWIASRTVFGQPSPWLRSHIEPYVDLLGGHIRPSFSDSLSFSSPANQVPVPLGEWLRVGVRWSGQKDVDCVAAHVAKVCSKTTARECHVFLSTLSRVDMSRLRTALERQKSERPIILHAVADSYPFTYESNSRKIFESNEQRVKMGQTRSWMDWLILSRMNYLIGQNNDTFLKTAAWAAQVQTDVVQSGTCNVQSLNDW